MITATNLRQHEAIHDSCRQRRGNNEVVQSPPAVFCALIKSHAPERVDLGCVGVEVAERVTHIRLFESFAEGHSLFRRKPGSLLHLFE